MNLDTTIACLGIAVVACVLIDLVVLVHQRRSARARPPVVLFGRGDDT